MSIEVQNLSFQYENTPVLTDISFEIKSGEFVGIFGPNGGGKTTLLKLIMGFLKPQKGSIRVAEKTPKDARKFIGYVPQISHLDRQFPITVLDVVKMGCLEKPFWKSYCANAKTKAEEALHQVGLCSFNNTIFGKLSGGQMQRVLFARALVSNPQILLLDEATASIDQEAENLIYNILKHLKNSTTIMMITHDLQTILKMTDRSICINQQLSSFTQDQVCDHFLQGLYHKSKPNNPH
jgi:zinc transport system ATP-binding protein